MVQNEEGIYWHNDYLVTVLCDLAIYIKFNIEWEIFQWIFIKIYCNFLGTVYLIKENIYITTYLVIHLLSVIWYTIDWLFLK